MYKKTLEKKRVCWILLFSLVFELLLISMISCKKNDTQISKNELVIFHAGSLSVPFREVSAEFNKLYPDVDIKAEAAGSRACARKICDLKKECDVMASADYKVVSSLLMQDYADYNIRFATNEMVIAYTEKSKYNHLIKTDNWYEILLKEDVALGRSDPDLDPCGYRTLILFQLAEKYHGISGLAGELQQKDEHIRPKETDLLALLEAGEIDYLFIYRSVAAQHGLNILLLPDQINLKSESFSEFYNTASVKLSGKEPGQFITRKGESMVYSVTIPKTVQNLEIAEKWISFLLSKEGREIMKKNGQSCIIPAKTDGFSILPDSLKELCEEASK